MKTFSCLVLLVVVAVASGHKPRYDIKDAPELFEKFVKDFNRHYKSEADRAEHYQAFVNTLHKINRANSGSGTDMYVINQFADYTPEELEKMKGIIIPQ